MNRSVKIAGVLLLALSAGACGRTDVRPIEQPTFTTPTTPAPAKYVAVPTCKQIEQKVQGLPKLRSGNENPSPFVDMYTGCEFQKIPDYPRIGLAISVWRDEPGKDKARERFDDSTDPADDGPADVGVGEQAKWQNAKDNDSCSLVILDANAVLMLDHKPSDKLNPKSEECRGRLKELARTFYAVVQPS